MQKAAGWLAWTVLALIAIACGGIGSAPGYDPARWAAHDPARADLVGTWTIAPLDEKRALDVGRTTSVPVELELREDGAARIRWRRLLQDIIGSGAWADLKAGKEPPVEPGTWSVVVAPRSSPEYRRIRLELGGTAYELQVFEHEPPYTLADAVNSADCDVGPHELWLRRAGDALRHSQREVARRTPPAPPTPIPAPSRTPK